MTRHFKGTLKLSGAEAKAYGTLEDGKVLFDKFTHICVLKHCKCKGLAEIKNGKN